MSLKQSRMQKDLYDTMLKSEREVAAKVGMDAAELDKGQKRMMRWAHAKAMGEYLYTMLTTQAEVNLDKSGPNHGVPASLTGPSGGAVHAHPMNQGPISHKKGNFIV